MLSAQVVALQPREKKTHVVAGLRLVTKGRPGSAVTTEGATPGPKSHCATDVQEPQNLNSLVHARVWSLACHVLCCALRGVTRLSDHCCACLVSLMCCGVVQCTVVQCSEVQCSAVQCSAVQCSAVQCSAVWCSVVVQCGAVWCSVLQCAAVWCSVVQCGAVQCSAVQCSVV